MFPGDPVELGRQVGDAVVRGDVVFDQRDCRKRMRMSFKGELQRPSDARIVKARRYDD